MDQRNGLADRLFDAEDRVRELEDRQDNQNQNQANMANNGNQDDDDFDEVRGLDNLIRPTKFSGFSDEDARAHLSRFDKWCDLKNHGEEARRRAFSLLFDENALTWYERLDDEVKENWQQLRDAFRNKYDTDESRENQHRSFIERRQLPTESTFTYIKEMQKLGNKLDRTEADIILNIVNGLLPAIRDKLLFCDVSTFAKLERAARAAESISKTEKGVSTVDPIKSVSDPVVKQLMSADRVAREAISETLAELTTAIRDMKKANKGIARDVSAAVGAQLDNAVPPPPPPVSRNNNNNRQGNSMPPMRRNWPARTATGRVQMSGACFYCNTPGHRIVDCRKRKADEMRNSVQRPGLNTRGPA